MATPYSPPHRAISASSPRRDLEAVCVRRLDRAPGQTIPFPLSPEGVHSLPNSHHRASGPVTAGTGAGLFSHVSHGGFRPPCPLSGAPPLKELGLRSGIAGSHRVRGAVVVVNRQGRFWVTCMVPSGSRCCVKPSSFTRDQGSEADSGRSYSGDQPFLFRCGAGACSATALRGLELPPAGFEPAPLVVHQPGQGVSAPATADFRTLISLLCPVVNVRGAGAPEASCSLHLLQQAINRFSFH